jgi:predicted nucleotidyltransferase
MKLEQALSTLRQAEAALRAKGVRHAALFGSITRGENRPDSDVDILIDFDPAASITMFDYVAVSNDIASLFDGPVDVIDREALKPHLRKPLAKDLVYAF